MTKTSAYYETTGDSLTGEQAERAYRAAICHLDGTRADYLASVKRLNSKIIGILK